jgi:hypothetical protein
MMMRARHPFVYAGGNLEAGEVFELVETTMAESLAVRRVLTNIGLAEPCDGEAKPAAKPKRYKGGRYNRRDLRAER